jgi:uncharacterized SAM-binding protein YcdF (DUF218 family)
MRKLRNIAGGILALGGIAAAALAIGFVVFVDTVQDWQPPQDPRAEGIVVLTGGAVRIDSALRLLQEGRAERLLISGVNPAVSAAAIGNSRDEATNRMLDCCVDLGHTAQNTIGNAAETRDWAAEQGFTSLIVVTSSYHMPRSLAELSDALPGAELIPYPVAHPDLNLRDWWRTSHAFSLLFREYGKYLVVSARNLFRLSPTANQTDPEAT